jgi:hypothetical protein
VVARGGPRQEPLVLGGVLLELRRQMALDQRVRELPLGPRDPHAVALEDEVARAAGTQSLTLARQRLDPIQERLDVLDVRTPSKARRNDGPQPTHEHSVYRRPYGNR